MNDRPDDDRLLEHEYDGIREYDNPLPRWWVIILWVTVAWSVVYLINVIPGVGIGAGRAKNYENEMAAAREQYGAAQAAEQKAVVIDDAAMLAIVADRARVEAGQQVFMTNCVACHRADAGGNIGPNLTDDYWIHGGQPAQIHGTITAGVLDKGMPAWGAVLTPDQVANVAAYVITLHGTHPKEPKAPQGVKVEEKEAGGHE